MRNLSLFIILALANLAAVGFGFWNKEATKVSFTILVLGIISVVAMTLLFISSQQDLTSLRASVGATLWHSVIGGL